MCKKIYHCDACRYTFETSQCSIKCPDCGKDAVRDATEEEIKEFYEIQEELREGDKYEMYLL